MDHPLQVGTDSASCLQVLWEDSERVFCRAKSPAGVNRPTVFAVVPVGRHQSPASVERLVHEFDLRDELDSAWALRPLKLDRDRDRTALLLEDPGGEPLARQLGTPMDIRTFLQVATGITSALGQVHHRGLIHKNIKPANIVVGSEDGNVRLTGFGIASRLSRERQAPEPPETIAGTLAYMAPEQTGRMNRSIDARSDLYAMGVTLYQMLTGVLPFTAADPMEWVHCHIAKRPVPPKERLAYVPGPISAIIAKLLSKTPEERYQTAAGVESDLQRCLIEWEERRRIDDFTLGTKDMPSRLLIPERLYGRDREIAALVGCFDRIISSGAPELVLVSGYSGIGKSALVNELHKVLVPTRGLFASGKFDQYKRDIPYATLVQAFQSLVRHLLSKNDAELTAWRQALLEALSPNASLMIDLIPELRLIIGDQPRAADLPAQQSQSRFHMVFQRFIAVFARPEHPLALFLDDLQWLDAATLDLLEDLLTRPGLQNLMLIGAYRDNEVSAAHPLMRTLETIRSRNVRVSEIALAPLAREHLQQLIADALRCEPERAAPLAELAHEKTGGIPLFVVQFLSSLAEEAFLSFDPAGTRWSWDIDRIHAQPYTDNVVDLMIGKLVRLPAEAQDALRQMACLGNSAEISTLSIVLGAAEEQIDAALWPARRQELVERSAAGYQFAHDRVQEAAYSLIPEDQRSAAHHRIGTLLADRTPRERREEAIFDIVNQLNRGTALIASREEREHLAELNLLAARRAQVSAAHASALAYIVAGAALLPEDAWERRHELAFGLELHRAECEFLTGALNAAEERLGNLAVRALSLPELAATTRLRIEIFVTLGRIDRAVEVILDYLRHIGVPWTARPSAKEVRDEYEQIWQRLGDRPIEALIDLPYVTDAAASGTMDVLLEAAPPALKTDERLLCLALCRMVNLSLEHGNSDASCSAYVWLAMVLGPHFGNYRAAFRFGKLGLDLVEQRGLDRFKARAQMLFAGHVVPWTQHVKTGQAMLRRSFEAANRVGDLTYAAYSCNGLIMNLLASGTPLGDVQREAEAGLDFVLRAQFGLVIDIITAQLQLVRTLRGLTPVFGSLDDAEFDEEQFEQHQREHPLLSIATCWYWIRKLQARFMAGDYASALEAASNAQELLWTSPSCLELADYHFYAALARSAFSDETDAVERPRHMEALAEHHRQFQIWAENCSENFECRAALISAEIARIEGRAVEAMSLYEQAIRSAQVNDLVHIQGIASEMAARFYTANGVEVAAQAYLRNARHCYLLWGADGKVRQLDGAYPRLKAEEPAPAPTSTIATPVEHLDLSTVIKLSQAVSGEIVMEKLVETLMRTALEQAGAERGLLVLSGAAEQRVAAEATVRGDSVVVRLCDEPVTGAALPESMLHYVIRTQESAVLDDAAATQSSFAADPYIRRRKARSVLCLPLLNQAKVIGVLFLENNLAPRVFAPAPVAVLKLLASQAAISLENTRLYRDLAERESKIRRLVDSNVIGIVIWDLNGLLIDANDAFLRMVQYDRNDLKAGIRWFDMTPPEWQEAHALEEMEELKTTGKMQAREKEYFRKDGSRVPVLIGAAAFEGQPNQGVAYILDLTERKRVEAEARESERRYREVQMELAHANRVATMGQLTGSIAHEVNQPISATVTNAQAALFWMDRQPPDLEETRQALTRILQDGKRAGDVIGRVRDLMKKTPPRQDLLQINGPIREVIELTRSEAVKNWVQVKLELAEDLPSVRGDPVQLKQVMLNLVVNAIEAMSGSEDDTRELLLSTSLTPSSEVLVSVRDTGPGLSTAARQHIFEAFYTTKPEGLGMGLSICRSIVEAHGGQLWAAESEAHGAAMLFTLPAHERPADSSGHIG